MLAAAPVLRAALCWGAEQPQAQPQPGKAAKGPLLSPLARALEGSAGTGECESSGGREGKRRDHVDSLTCQVILSSP